MIKLIIVDYYGSMTLGSYKETCQWLSKKYKIPYKKVYSIVYHKYFSQAALGKMSERQFALEAIKELGLKETPESIMKKHISFQVPNKPVVKLMKKLQNQGYKILILSKNTPPQFKVALRKMHTRRYFKNIINTFDLKLPKASKETMLYVFKKFKVKPQEVIYIDDQGFNLPQAKKLGVKTIYYRKFRDLQNGLKQVL